jgi:hypothetical protein
MSESRYSFHFDMPIRDSNDVSGFQSLRRPCSALLSFPRQSYCCESLLLKMMRKRGSNCSQDDMVDEESAAFLNDASLSKQPKSQKTEDGSRKFCLFSTAVLSITVIVYLFVSGTIKGRCNMRTTIVLVHLFGVPSGG